MRRDVVAIDVRKAPLEVLGYKGLPSNNFRFSAGAGASCMYLELWPTQNEALAQAEIFQHKAFSQSERAETLDSGRF